MIVPDWPVDKRVQARLTTRNGGFSSAPWDSFNLALHVDDDELTVQRNRLQLVEYLPGVDRIQWLNQVHGKCVVEASDIDQAPEADAVWTREAGVACAVLTADCLPVLICDRAATVVAAVHAGWRGLASRVIATTLASLDVDPGELLAYLGPAICGNCFEVGPEVRSIFLDTAMSQAHQRWLKDCFQLAPGRPGHYLADLYRLARGELLELGLTAVFGGELCTVEQPESFYSYRRDGRTGRQVALIYLR